MRCYLIVDLINMLLFHLCCISSDQVLWCNLSLLAVISSYLISSLLVASSTLAIAKNGVGTPTWLPIHSELAEGERYAAVPKPEQTIHSVNLACGYGVQVVEAGLASEDYELSWQEVDILLGKAIGCAEVHRDPSLQGQRDKDLLKGGVGVNMRGYTLPRLIVIDSQLIEGEATFIYIVVKCGLLCLGRSILLKLSLIPIEAEVFEIVVYPWEQKGEEVRHVRNLLCLIDVVSTVHELIAKVLDPSLQHLDPVSLV